MYQGLAILFALLGVGTVALASTRKGSRGWYLVALCLGLAGCAFLLARGGTWHPGRIVLVITPGATAADQDAVRRLRELAAPGDIWKELAWATLTRNGNDFPRWTSTGPLPTSPSRFPLPPVDAPVDFKKTFRLGALADHAAGSFWPKRPTLIIVLDDRSEIWKQQVARGVAAADEGLDVLVWDRRAQENQGSLRLTLPDELLLNKPYDRGGSLQVDVPDPVTNGLVTLKVANSVVDDQRLKFDFDLARRNPQPVYLGTKTAPTAAPLEGVPHFRYVEATATMKLAGRDQLLRTGGFVRGVKLFVDLRRIRLDEVTRPDYWSRLRWREQLADDELKPFAAFDHSYLLRHVRAASPADVGIPRLVGLTDVLRGVPPPDGSLAGYILENPTLDEVQGYKEKVGKLGASLLILDPEPVSVAADDPKLEWLPAWPLIKPLPANRRVTFHTENRLYFLAENSRLSALRSAQDPPVPGALSVNDYQGLVRAALDARLSPTLWHPPRPTGSPAAEDDILAPPRIADAPAVAAATPSSTSAAPMFVLKTPVPRATWLTVQVSETVAPSLGEKILAALPGVADHETEATHIGFRLWLLLADSGKRDPKNRLPLINTNDRYEHTDIVLFVTDVRQPDSITVDPAVPFFRDALAKYQITLTASTDFKTTDILSRLQAAGVRVHLIAARPVDISKNRPSLGPENDSTLLPSAFIDGGTPSPVFGGGSRTLKRDALIQGTTAGTLQKILDHLKPPDATIQIKQYGRVIDWRVQNSAPAPWRYSVLSVLPSREDCVYASVKTVGDERPLIAANFHGNGQVIVCGYSPFAMDVWVADSFRDDLARRLRDNATCTFPRSAESVLKYDRGGTDLAHSTPAGSQAGWGVQRLLDFCELTCRRSPVTSNGFARRVEFDPATGGLFLHLGLSPGQGISSPPTLKLKIGTEEISEVTPTRIRSDTQEAIYQLARRDNYRSEMVIVRIKDDAKPVATVDTAGLPTKPSATLGGVTAAWVLSRGGHFLPMDETMAAKNWPLPGAGVVAWIMIAVLALFLLFLLGYRWQTIRQTVRSLLRPRSDAREQGARQTLPVDTEAALAEFGFNPGKPATTRIPGEPAGWRLYEPSDSLMLARIADLAPYTDLGEVMDLPFVRPRVKLRKSLRAFRAEVWLDLHLRLQLTPAPENATRADYIRALLLAIADNIWSQGGSLKVRALQDPTCEFGPLTQGHMQELAAWHDDVDRLTFRSAGYDPRLGIELEEGTRLYAISDFAYLDTGFAEMLQDSGANGLQGLRVVRVMDETELTIGSLHASVPGFELYDRSDLDPEELRQESTGILRELRNGLSGIPNTRLVDLNTRHRFDDMLEKLEREGFFDE